MTEARFKTLLTYLIRHEVAFNRLHRVFFVGTAFRRSGVLTRLPSADEATTGFEWLYPDAPGFRRQVWRTVSGQVRITAESVKWMRIEFLQ